MTNQSVLFSSDEGICVYFANEAQDSFEFLHVPSMDDILNEYQEYRQLNETSLQEYLDNNCCFETLDYVYLKMHDQFHKLSKRELCTDAVKILIDGIDQILCVAGFVKMATRQRSRLESILIHILSRSVTIGPTLLLPIVSEIDYLKHSDYDSDDIQWKVELSTSSSLWLEAVSKICFKTMHPVDAQYSYSCFCKNLLFR